jgi:hypothetical protein
MNAGARPPGQEPPLDPVKQAEAHLSGVAGLAAVLTLFGLPAACYGGCASQSLALAVGLPLATYVVLVGTVVHWFRYRVAHPAARVAGLNVLMVLIALVTLLPLVFGLYLVTQR